VSDPTAFKALENELHVWSAFPDKVSAQHLNEQFLPLLNSEEKERYQRFHFDHDRHTYLAAHALVRITLSRYAHCTPAQWRFIRGAQGKPELEAAPDLPPIHFNLSHTSGMVACAVTLNRACGVDVERTRTMKDMAGIAEAVFSNAEIAFFDQQSEADKAQIFFKFWTLKEAYIKAIGQGLSASLKGISFEIAEPYIRVTVEDEPLNTTRWQFHHRNPSPTHHLAVAVESTSQPVEIIYHELDLNDNFQTSLQRSYSDFRCIDTL
jgi:4'-phosphopantetheinyl transferase